MRSVFKSLARNNFFFGEKVHTFKHARRQTKNNMETRRTREKKTHSQYVVWIFRRTINAPELVPTYNRVNPATPWCRSRPISHKTKFTLIWIRKIIAKNVQFLQVDVECALYVYWVAAKIISCFIFIFLFFFSVVVVVAASDSSMAFALSSASTAINFTPLDWLFVLSCWIVATRVRLKKTRFQGTVAHAIAQLEMNLFWKIACTHFLRRNWIDGASNLQWCS